MLVKPLLTVNVNSDDLENVEMFSVGWSYRYKFCKQCQEIKPPRAHHCFVCGYCVMRMDHHCPWIGNCVGLLNHKIFWLFIFYSECGLFTIAGVLYRVTHTIEFESIKISSFALGLSLTLLLLLHTLLIMQNWTTLEMCGLIKDNIFREQTIGQKWRLIFGDNCLFWFMPVDGTDPVEGLDYKASIPVSGILLNGE